MIYQHTTTEASRVIAASISDMINSTTEPGDSAAEARHINGTTR